MGGMVTKWLVLLRASVGGVWMFSACLGGFTPVSPPTQKDALQSADTQEHDQLLTQDLGRSPDSDLFTLNIPHVQQRISLFVEPGLQCNPPVSSKNSRNGRVFSFYFRTGDSIVYFYTNYYQSNGLRLGFQFRVQNIKILVRIHKSYMLIHFLPPWI